MDSITLNDEMNIEVKLRLIQKINSEPLSGNEFFVRLYDKDVFNDDYPGESVTDKEGIAKFNLYLKKIPRSLNPDDKPDSLFCNV